MDVQSEQDKWWQRTGKNILNRKDCAKAAWAEGAAEQERRHLPVKAERDEWRNMVAVLCGDGGHYHAEHGTAATRAYIEKKLFDRREQHDKMVATLTEIRDAEPVRCPRCEGNGRQWADGGAHYYSSSRETTVCGTCGGSGYVQPENAQDIAAAALADETT